MLCIAGIAMLMVIDGNNVGGTKSWLENQVAVCNYYEEECDYSFLIPITKEEFYSLEPEVDMPI